MKSCFYAFFTISLLFLSNTVFGLLPTSGKVIIGILDQSNKSDFEQSIFPVLRGELESCSKCQLVNITPYNEKGEFDRQQLPTAIAKMEDLQILLFNWNEKAKNENAILVEALKKKVAAGLILVAPAGQPRSSESSAPLSRTIMGQIKGAVIIGELGERDRLLGSSFFGPEMLTAIRPTKEHIGKGLAPIFFAASLSRNFSKHSDWIGFFAQKKQKTRKIWLEMGDLFW